MTKDKDLSRKEKHQRWRVLHQLEEWLETPMVVLSFVWLSLVIIELMWTTSGIFELVGIAIWIIFVAEFLLRFGLAPEKYPFLRANVITVIALIAPAFRLFRALRLLRFTRGLRLVRIIGTANRSLNALRKSFRRRGLGYLLGATVLVALLGAAGMLALEPAHLVEGGFNSYGDSLWWTVMLVATIGTDFWPQTAEGRVLAFLLAVYGLAVFGYITASFASFFIGQDARGPRDTPRASRQLATLQAEITKLRSELKQQRP